LRSGGRPSGGGKGTVLIIDDEHDLIELVRYNLENEGYDVIEARDGSSGFDLARRRLPDLIVLDVMMPQTDGLEVCRRLRADPRTHRVPVIMLTARASEADRVVGLELGADDYVVKPFSPRELVARVKAQLRRSAQDAEPRGVLRVGPLVIDAHRHEVTYDGQRRALTATEFRILSLLAGRPGRVFSRDDIVSSAMGRDVAITDRAIDVHVTAIRRKLGGGGGGAMIETVRGFGYKLRDE